MIATEIEPQEDSRNPGQPKDNIADLWRYVRAAREEGEKLHSLWMENCQAGTEIQDFDLAVIEAKATQKLNKNSRVKLKNYHLVVSFHPDDQVPNTDDLKYMAKEFAKALGFEEHQFLAGVHTDRDHVHMHLAFNKVNPKTFKVHTPFQDHFKLAEVCARMERQFDLIRVHDKEQQQDKGYARDNPRAKDFEAHTWEQSFDSYVKEHKDQITQMRDQSKTWGDFQKELKTLNLGIKPRANGLVFYNLKGKEHMKASALGRDFSMQALQQRFGPYQGMEKEGQKQAPAQQPKPRRRTKHYKRRPLTRHPATAKYWRRYLGQKNGSQTLTHRAFKTWKEFLQYEALDDVLAMAIITHHKQLLGLADQALAIPKGRPKFRPLPIRGKIHLDLPSADNSEAENLGAKWDKRESAWQATEATPNAIGQRLAADPMSRIYLKIPFSKADMAKQLGCRWDQDKKSWYATGETPEPLKEVIEDQMAAEHARNLYNEAKDWATPENNTYLAREGLKVKGLKQDQYGRLLIPMRDQHGTIQGLYCITGDGKVIYKGSREKGLVHLVDPEKLIGREGQEILITNSFKDAVKLQQKHGKPVIACMKQANWSEVIRATHEKFPEMKLVTFQNAKQKSVSQSQGPTTPEH